MYFDLGWLSGGLEKDLFFAILIRDLEGGEE